MGQKERIAVRGRPHDRLRADIGGRTRPVLDDELLAEPLRQPLTDQSRNNVGATTGRVPDDDADWLRRMAAARETAGRTTAAAARCKN
jgi:hypothetical protein